MTDDTSRVPKLRFPGFTGAWEQRKLRDYLVPSKEKNSALSYGKDEVLSVSGDAGVVNQIQFQGRSYAGASTKDYGVVQTGDVIYTKSPLKKNPFGIIKTNKGKAGIVSTLYAVYKPKDNTYTPFVEVYFDDDARLNNYLRPLVNKGAKNDMKVSKSGALTGLICFPGATEQRMLSEFFQQLEDLITLHQRKLSHLRELKRGLLQKMFPKSGEDRPEVRFPGFADAWEQRKLGELVQSFDYGLNASAIEFDGKNKYLRITDIDDETHQFNTDALTSPDADLKTADNFRLRVGDVLFARTGASVGKTYRYKGSDGLVYFAGFLIRARTRPEYDSEFLFQNTLTDRYMRYISITSRRSGQPGVNAQEYAEFRIFVPSLAEQKRTSGFFSMFDDLITLHQRKLSHLQQQKKALLQQMFV